MAVVQAVRVERDDSGMDPRLRSTVPNPAQLQLPIGPAVAQARKERLALIPAPAPPDESCRVCGARAIPRWKLCGQHWSETYGVESYRRSHRRRAA